MKKISASSGEFRRVFYPRTLMCANFFLFCLVPFFIVIVNFTFIGFVKEKLDVDQSGF